MASTEAGFGVYVHWPFCASKCPYCDFNSHVRAAGIDEPLFLAAFVRELEYMAARAPGRIVDSIFLGGGTPSLMKPATVATILETIARLWPVSPAVEITMEANPSSVEAGRLRGYRAAGVNRASLGVQALADVDLRTLGRLHSVDEALAAIALAAEIFPRMSFDLIYARPGQTPKGWRDELLRAIDMSRGHLSLYQLTIEPGTAYAALHAAGKLAIPDPELADDLYDLTQEVAEQAGLPAYEISNHAAPGQESRHNLVYWRYGEYAGVGPGAHGRLIAGDGRHALVSERLPEGWMAAVEARGHGLIEDELLATEEAADELLLMGLRLAEGVNLDRLQRIGAVLPAQATVDRLSALGLLTQPAPDRLVATRRGRFVLNELVLQLSVSLVPTARRPDRCLTQPAIGTS